MNRLSITLTVLLLIAVGIILYQNIGSDFNSKTDQHSHDENQLYTCGMHPDIISEEPGNCPICEMKLTPIKNKKNVERKIVYYRAPMDPNEIYSKPGKSKMGMDLVPVYSDDVDGGNVISIDPVVEQNMNVKTFSIEENELTTEIIANGIIKIDERKQYHINAKTSGWIEKLYTNFEGQKISKGDKLLEIYSPDLIAAQQEYLSAIRYRSNLTDKSSSSLIKSADQLIDKAYDKLKLLEISPQEIMQLENNDEVLRTVSLYSPFDGYVIKKNVSEGQKISSGMLLLHIADLSSLWMKADIYERNISSVKLGNPITFTLSAYPGEIFQGKIDYIDPILNPNTRTISIRANINNTNNLFKPDMLANVNIAAHTFGKLPLIPEGAVIRNGNINIAIISLGNGKYKPAEITLGHYSNGFYQVKQGLSKGNKIVTSAQFLIDSESNLKAALSSYSRQENDDKEKIIDVDSLDINKNGQLYECPMDWEIIEDKEGKCPKCEMKLKKYSINEVKKNLKSNGFKIKSDKKNDHSSHDHSSQTQVKKSNEIHKSQNEYGIKSPLIRLGDIDLEEIDINHDHKLFQCPMDWNIISDEPGRCPVCEMKLKKYSVKDTRENLLKHGYKAREITHKH